MSEGNVSDLHRLQIQDRYMSDIFPSDIDFKNKMAWDILENEFLARGKTYISTRLSRYLNWVGIKTRLFNVGMYRRKNSYTSKMAHSADFFDPKNEDAVRLRESWRKAALNDIIQWVRKPL